MSLQKLQQTLQFCMVSETTRCQALQRQTLQVQILSQGKQSISEKNNEINLSEDMDIIVFENGKTFGKNN